MFLLNATLVQGFYNYYYNYQFVPVIKFNIITLVDKRFHVTLGKEKKKGLKFKRKVIIISLILKLSPQQNLVAKVMEKVLSAKRNKKRCDWVSEWMSEWTNGSCKERKDKQ